MGRFTNRYIEEAKEADLVDYMLVYHPDKVISRSGIRDAAHDSLVLYPHTYCRYSTMEINDSIAYLTKYQGYDFKDAVNSLHKFAEGSVKPLVPEPETSRTKTAVKKDSFYRPVKTGNIRAVEQYLTKKRGISETLVDMLEVCDLVYAAHPEKYDNTYACFANREKDFYVLRNTSKDGVQKLCYTKEAYGYWYFTTQYVVDIDDPRAIAHEFEPEEDLPIFITEAPIDAISLYELTFAGGIYVAMAGLKERAAERAVRDFTRPVHFLHPRRVVIAVDNDRAGNEFGKNLEKDLEKDFEKDLENRLGTDEMTGLSCFTVERMKPVEKDWNEDLVKRRSQS